MKIHDEIPWPADPAMLPRDDDGRAVVGRFVVAKSAAMGTWGYGLPDESSFVAGDFQTEWLAVNEGALCDDYQGSEA